MRSGLQGSISELDVFSIFINDIESGIECNFADDTKLTGAVDMLEGRDVTIETLTGLRHGPM